MWSLSFWEKRGWNPSCGEATYRTYWGVVIANLPHFTDIIIIIIADHDDQATYSTETSKLQEILETGTDQLHPTHFLVINIIMLVMVSLIFIIDFIGHLAHLPHLSGCRDGWSSTQNLQTNRDDVRRPTIIVTLTGANSKMASHHQLGQNTWTYAQVSLTIFTSPPPPSPHTHTYAHPYNENSIV